jgi:hypothetical protein
MEGFVAARLTEEELARVDGLARSRGMSRDEALAALVRTGIASEERRTLTTRGSNEST